MMVSEIALPTIHKQNSIKNLVAATSDKCARSGDCDKAKAPLNMQGVVWGLAPGQVDPVPCSPIELAERSTK